MKTQAEIDVFVENLRTQRAEDKRTRRKANALRYYYRYHNTNKCRGRRFTEDGQPKESYAKLLAWQAANPEEYRRSQRKVDLWKLYRITLEQYEELLIRQDGKCASCGEPNDKLVVDHCHSTNVVRGLLCNGCNSGIGHLKDDPHKIRLAADYVERTANGCL